MYYARIIHPSDAGSKVFLLSINTNSLLLGVWIVWRRVKRVVFSVFFFGGDVGISKEEW